jgi:hypothetical protein
MVCPYREFIHAVFVFCSFFTCATTAQTYCPLCSQGGKQGKKREMELKMAEISFKDAISKYVNYAKSINPEAPNDSWYVGVTIDLETRKAKHESEKDIICDHFKYFVYYDNRIDAEKFETALTKEGFVKYAADLDPDPNTKSATSPDISVKRNEDKHHIYIYHAVKKK